MALRTVLGITGGIFTVGGYIIDQVQRKQDAKEAAEQVYREHHPEESIFDGLEEGKNGIEKIVKF